MTQSLELDGPEQYTEALDIYLEELAAAGIDVDRAWAEEMYRYGTLLGFVYPVVAGGALTIDDPRHVELCRTLLVAHDHRARGPRRLRSPPLTPRDSNLRD